MSVPRPQETSYDLTVQPTVSTLHIPVSHAFIPFQQFSIADAAGLRNPADDNNNKTAVPVVSVVAAMSGLCPAIPVVSMQPTAHLAQTVVAPTIIPGVVTPMTVHAANCLTPTTTMTVAKTLNITSHISVPLQQQQQAVGLTTINQQTNVPNINQNSSHQNTQTIQQSTKPTNISGGNNSSPLSNNNNNIGSSSSNKPNSKTSNGSSEQNEDLVKPVFKDGELVLEVECGQNKAILYLSKLCQGSKGPCINFQSSWLTPNEFQFVSGRETAKDWKRSIRHHGKSLKLLLAKGILNVHPTMCDCDGCRQGATLTRKGEKRRIPNGERKPRKPTSSSGTAGSDGNTAGSFRLVGSSTMAAHPATTGATQTKPEVRRSAIDKPKMEVLTSPSSLTESSGKLFPKLSTIQRPCSLITPRDSSTKQASASSTISPASAIAASSSSPSAGTLHSNTLTPFTPGQARVFSAAVTPTTSNGAPTVQMAAHSPHETPSQPTAATSAPSDQLLAACLSTSLFSQIQCPNFVAQSSHSDSQDPEFKHENSDEHSKPELSDEDDNQYDDDTDSSQNVDDDLDDESDDESDKYIKDSDNNDSISDEDADESIKTNTNDNTGVFSSLTLHNDIKCVDNGNDNQSDDKDDGKCSAATEPPEKMATDSLVDSISREDKQEAAASEPTTSSTTAVTAIAVSTFPGTCSQPLSVSVPGMNVRSEHIWVPPRLSPPGDSSQKTSCASGKSPTDNACPSQESFKIDTAHSTLTQVKENDKNSISKKVERAQHVKENDNQSGPRNDNSSASTNNKEFQSIERHLTRNFEDDKSVSVKCDPGQVRPIQTVAGNASNDKNVKDKEREERHKQRVREERSRREREERNRKDRERDERREYERREEKDSEKRRHEEKERRDHGKAQSEGSTSIDATSVAALMDLSRRPTGGVAEAAAFSDYMRMLAAGHGHSFISPAFSYMPAILPLRPQEASIPALLHPMSAYGHQLNGLPKDNMMYQTAGGVLSNYGSPQFGPIHPLLQRPPYTSQQSLLDYQRTLSAASSYPWPAAAYPYFLHDITSASAAAQSAGSLSTLAAAAKRPSSELEAAMEMNSKRMRMEGRPAEYTSPWDYFATAASQHQRGPAMTPSLPCGLESVSMDKTAEYLRKRYMEYGPQAAAYLSAFPEYVRSPYHCACADHRDDNIIMWSVDDVCKFLHSVEGCAVYSDHFREQRVTGRILALLTSDHLVKTMGMKLVSAVQLAEAVARKLQDSNKISSCEACRNIALTQTFHPMALPL